MHFCMALFIPLLACAALFFCFLRALAALRAPRQSWPPGPPALPILGHLHLLGNLPHQSLCNLSRRYGPLMALRLGRVPTIIASSPDMAKAILQTHDLTFAFRPPSAAAAHMYFGSASLGFLPHGPLFKRLRQLLAAELFSPKRLESFRYLREEEMRELVRSVLQVVVEKPQEPVELRASLLATTNNINWRMATGKRVREVSSCESMREKRDLQSLVEEVMHLLGVFTVGDFIPWLAWLDLQGHVKRMKEAGRRVNAVMQALIEERREELAEKAGRHEPQELSAPDNLLDRLLLVAAQDAENNDAPPDAKITDDNIKGLLLDLFAGGSTTSSSTVEWALANLITNPRAMEKVQDELDKVVGKARLVEEPDIPNLAYLGMVLKESMRLHPVAPLLIPHEAAQECKVYGYQIPSKSRAYVNTWAIGRDPSIWVRPLEFWPERFQCRKLDLGGISFELLPFGVGRRRCPASALGLLNVHLILAKLVQGFTWSIKSFDSQRSNSKMHLIDMSESYETALVMAKPLCVFATPRLPLDLY